MANPTGFETYVPSPTVFGCFEHRNILFIEVTNTDDFMSIYDFILFVN